MSVAVYDERIPPHRVIVQAQLFKAPARIEMRPGNVDASIGTMVAVRCPNPCRIQIHDWDLFGLHELEEDAPAR